jgi:glycosyltransferase involved in cell wall biosynthesis
MKILIVIPVLNEEKILKENVLKIFNFCQKNLTINWQIVIVDNRSTDQTVVIAKDLGRRYQQIEYLYVDKVGKGVAIRTGWQKYSADIYCFMDADLATDLSALVTLISSFKEGYDMVIGSRFLAQSQVSRSLIRKMFSFGYHLVARILLNLKIKDLPCGFKAINSRIKENVLPKVKDEAWFFDSELVIVAEKQGYRIKEIPIIWQEPRKGRGESRVKTLSLSLAYFKQLLALKKRLAK